MTTITDDGTVFEGSDDADSIAVLANDVTVDAGIGNDWISAILDMASDPDEDADGDGSPDPQDVTTDLRGDNGDDRIHASLRGIDDYDYSGLTIAARISGGAGNDQFRLDVQNNLAEFSATVNGGAGADDIFVTADSGGDSSSGAGSVALDAGDGDDTVAVHTRGGSSSGDVTIRAGNGNDSVAASASFVDPDGTTSGTCFLYGGDGDDALKGNGVSNHAEGGVGNDRIALAGDGNTALGGAGLDWIDVASWVGISVYGGDGSGGSTASGGYGDDTVSASLDFSFSGVGSNEIQGGDGNDLLSAEITFALDRDAGEEPSTATGLNKIEGGNGYDRLTGVVKITGDLPDGSDLHSELFGGSGDDRLTVKGGDGNILDGGQGNDTLNGGSGADLLRGMAGDDLLRGGGGDDTFLFGYVRSNEHDRIAGFKIGEDVIDLSQIDANRDRDGEQSFTFGAREGTGRIWLTDEGKRTIVHVDDGHRVLEIALLDGNRVDAGDYSADDFLL